MDRFSQELASAMQPGLKFYHDEPYQGNYMEAYKNIKVWGIKKNSHLRIRNKKELRQYDKKAYG